MGQVITPEDAYAVLRQHNPRSPEAAVVAYATAWAEYETADENIREHGTVVFHPRSGAPISNPYLSIRADCERRMNRLKGIKADALWARRAT